MNFDNERHLKTTPPDSKPDEHEPASSAPGGTAADQNPDTPPGESSDEIGGRPGPDPARYGDWEKNGRCIDF